jgi:hypothetical protein
MFSLSTNARTSVSGLTANRNRDEATVVDLANKNTAPFDGRRVYVSRIKASQVQRCKLDAVGSGCSSN